MSIEMQINNLIDATLNANRGITNRAQIEQSSDSAYSMWHNIGLLLHNNFITTHLTLLSSFSVCACSYMPAVIPPTSESIMKNTLRSEMEYIEIRENNKYLGAQKLIMFIYNNHIATITKFQGASTTVISATVDIDITLYHNRIKEALEEAVVNFINSIPHDYFNTGADLFEKVREFNKNLAKLLYDSSLHFITSSDGVYTLITAAGATPGPLPYNGAVFS